MADFTATTSVKGRLDLIDHFLANRQGQGSSSSTIGILLHGDPGTGKTSFIKSFATLVGVELIVIEAPHITEEHIINIPFIVFKNQDDSGAKGNQKAEAKGTDIVLADSHLYTKLKSAKPIPDAQLLKNIYSGHEQNKTIWEELGGNETTIPADIKKFRSHTNLILFLDEFFRQSSPRIINMLRGILNGRIGMHTIPSEAYVVYASNMKDEGVEEMSSNQNFEFIEHENPDKEEWFSWLVNKYKDTDHLKMDVVNAFYKILKQKDLSSLDVNADVRASPRTWEQVLLYISSSLPVKDEAEANALLANVRSKFTHYKTGERHEIAGAVMDAVSKLIKETSKIEISTTGNGPDAWRATLAHQIKQKEKLGKLRTYVPIVSGPPGIGKTSEMARMAHEDLNLRYIYIDCSTLDPEMTMGIPIANPPKEGESMDVKFSMPQLYKQIMDDIKSEDKAFVAKMTAEEKKAYDKQKYKYLVFFDELNRTSTKVFNGLRRVLLEKDFGEGLELPESAIMVAAINPHEVGKRTTDLTQHMRDVVDVIDSQPSWKATEKYLDGLKVDASPIAQKVAKGTIVKMMQTLKTKSAGKPLDQRPFYIDLGDNELYISPRELTHMITISTTKLDLKLGRIQHLLSSEDAADKEKALHICVDSLFSTIKGTLDNALHKQQIDATEFLNDLHAWLETHIEAEGLFFKKAKTKGLVSILEPYFKDPKKDLTKEIELINYVEGHDIQEFRDELAEYLSSIIREDEKHLTDEKHATRAFSAGKIKDDATKMVSNIEHLIHEVVLAFKVNDVSNEMLDGVRTAVAAALKEAANSFKADQEKYMDILVPILALTKRLKDVIKA